LRKPSSNKLALPTLCALLGMGTAFGAQIEESAEPIADRYIVVLKSANGAGAGREAISKLAEALAARHRAAVDRIRARARRILGADVETGGSRARPGPARRFRRAGRNRAAERGWKSRVLGLDRIDQRDLPLDDSYSRAPPEAG
jgi:hypothetical protein